MSIETLNDAARNGSSLDLGQENEQEFARLHRALDIAEGFSLFCVWVHDLVSAEILTHRLRSTYGETGFRIVDVAQAQAPFLEWLFSAACPTTSDELIIFVGWEHPTVDQHAFARLNEHRNEWIERVACRHLIVLHGPARRLIRWQAPDVYAVRSGDFYFAPPAATEARAIATWVLAGWSTSLEPEEYLEQAQVFAEDTSPTGRILWGRATVHAVDTLRIRGRLDEAERLLSVALTRDSPKNDALRGQLILRAGLIAQRLGRLDEARDHYTQAEALYRKERDDLGLANTLQSLGDLESRLGEIDLARDHYTQAEALYRKERADLGLGYVSAELARLAAITARGDVESFAREAVRAAVASKSPDCQKYVATVLEEIRADNEST